MSDLIPILQYGPFYYHALMIIAIMILLHGMSFDVADNRSVLFFNVFGYFIAILLVLYIGFRPIDGIFVDMKIYAQAYEMMQQGTNLSIDNDYAFNYFMLFCSKIMSVEFFFFIVALIYILPCYFFSKIYFGRYWFYSFFMLIGSFSFWAYGTNGIRNGVATSVFILALCFYNNRKILMYCFFILAFMIHSSLIIPVMAFVLSGIYKNPKMYLYIWLAAIPLSLAGSKIWQEIFFNHLGFSDRTTGYMEGQKVEGSFSSTGFRWDFLFYSSFGIISGYYYIFVKKISDRFYNHLYGIFTIANAFWVLVITAYLSWFMMAPIISYPMFRYKIWKDQYKTFGIILMLYYLFTYLMFLKG